LTRAPSVERTLHRQRLVDRVLSTPLTILVAPEGSGATTAAAQAANSTGLQVAWCRLATGYAAAADVVSMVGSASGTDIEPAARLLDLAEQLLSLTDDAPLAIVIDDHHLAVDASIDRVIAESLELLPPECRVIITTHARPAGLIGLVRASEVTVIDGHELAFTEDEAIALFAEQGGDAETARSWNLDLAGWAHAVAAGAYQPDSAPTDHLTTLLDRCRLSDPVAPNVIDAVSALPYVLLPLLQNLGIDIDAARLSAIVQASPLISEYDNMYRLTDTARAVALQSLSPEQRSWIRTSGGRFLADDDPTTAIDALIDAGEPEAAADVLADHLSSIGVERALTWLYRLPAELRRRFPPVLAAGQATVEVDSALALARDRVDTADNERSRREALFALGSIEAHRGELAAAAGAFEAAIRAARDEPDVRARIAGELANTRWLLGDTLGAGAARDDADDSPAMNWLSAQLNAVDALSDWTPSTSDDPFDLAAVALTHLVTGTTDDALVSSTSAYSAAVETGGEPLVAAAAVHAWALLRAGQADDAALVGNELERRLGPRHQLARVHGALIRERCSRQGSDRGEHERDQRRLRDLRAVGYATIDDLATRVLDREVNAPDDALIGVEVRVLGTHTAIVDGRTIRRSDWKSKKAFEVLTVLASFGPSGGRREQVIEAVWPGRDPDKGRTLLRTALSEVRRVLEPGRPPGEPSRYLATTEDTIALLGSLDIDTTTGFDALSKGIAPEVVETEWAAPWVPVVERSSITSAARCVTDATADGSLREQAFEFLIRVEPWQRSHYDGLGALHKQLGDDAAAADVERRWFADD
jgi:hypothetical protein